MTSQVFYRKWRPQTLAELAGQTHVTQTLLNALKNSSISHAYLFCGPRGTGKTSTARILAKAVNCLTNQGRGEPCNICDMCRAITEDRAMDVIEIDAASNRGIDDIRDLREKVNYAPTQARRKVYIIDEFHMLSKDASNALLKTLEEPPPHVIFILATTEAHKVLPTILSRCQHFEFHRLSRNDVITQLTKVSQAEHIQIDPQALNLIARNSTGSLRDAYNLLEQLTAYYGFEISSRQVQSMLGITGDSRVREIAKYIISGDLSGGIRALNSVSSDGLDLRQFNRELVEFLRSLLLVKTGAAESVDLTVEDIADLKEMAEKASLPQILNVVKIFGQVDFSNTENTALPLELAIVDYFLSLSRQSGEETQTAVPRETPKMPAAKSDEVKHKPAADRTETPKIPFKAASVPVITVEPKKKEVAPEPEKTSKAQPITIQPVKAVEKEELPAKESPSGTPASPVIIERLKSNWKSIMDNLPANQKKTNAAALLRSASPIAFENETVVISLKYAIHKENMEKPECLQVVEKIFSDFVGRPCKVHCVCENENNHLVKQAQKMGAQITSVEEK
jgi:DNA polymerase III subunit gamma/tau